MAPLDEAADDRELGRHGSAAVDEGDEIGAWGHRFFLRGCPARVGVGRWSRMAATCSRIRCSTSARVRPRSRRSSFQLMTSVATWSWRITSRRAAVVVGERGAEHLVEPRLVVLAAAGDPRREDRDAVGGGGPAGVGVADPLVLGDQRGDGAVEVARRGPATVGGLRADELRGRADDAFLALEVVEHRLVGDAGRLGDLRQGHVVVVVGEEQGRRLAGDAIPGRGRVRGPGRHGVGAGALGGGGGGRRIHLTATQPQV